MGHPSFCDQTRKTGNDNSRSLRDDKQKGNSKKGNSKKNNSKDRSGSSAARRMTSFEGLKEG